jgi:hypothetical protein
MKIKLVNGLPYHPTARHPHTGKRLQALMVLKGRPVWPVMGASDDDGGDSDGNDDGDADQDSSTGDDSGKDDQSSSKKDDDAKKEPTEEAKLREKLRLADQNRVKAEKELQKLKDKDLSELEKAKKDLAEKEKVDAAREEKAKALARENAFLKASQRAKVQWEDPELAQQAAKLEALEIDDDGQIDGIDAAIKKLIKDKPFLVAKSKDDDGEEEDKTKGPSGSAVGGGRKKTKADGKLSEEDLRKRFSALRT